MTDSTDIRRRLTLKPYRFDTRMDEDPIYDHMSQEIRMADGKGLSKFNYKFPDIGKGKSYDFNNFLSIIFSEKDRKKENQKFIKEVLLPAFNKESVKFYEKSPSAKIKRSEFFTNQTFCFFVSIILKRIFLIVVFQNCSSQIAIQKANV